MPIPVNPDYFAVSTVWTADMPSDPKTFSQTLYFHDTGVGLTPDEVADNIQALMSSFWNDVNAPGTITLASRMSSVIEPLLTRFFVYDLGQAAPRTPYERTTGITAVAATDPLPNECAICLSYKSGVGSPTSGGTIDKNDRGRIYIGPLTVTASVAVADRGDARVAGNMTQAIVGGAELLLAGTAELEWVQYSRTLNQFQIVSGGFVNNAFDTQRRRGVPESSRTTFG